MNPARALEVARQWMVTLDPAIAAERWELTTLADLGIPAGDKTWALYVHLGGRPRIAINVDVALAVPARKRTRWVASLVCHEVAHALVDGDRRAADGWLADGRTLGDLVATCERYERPNVRLDGQHGPAWLRTLLHLWARADALARARGRGGIPAARLVAPGAYGWADLYGYREILRKEIESWPRWRSLRELGAVPPPRDYVTAIGEDLARNCFSARRAAADAAEAAAETEKRAGELLEELARMR